jgi:uncharacterized protein YecT (DUF1311 family)
MFGPFLLIAAASAALPASAGPGDPELASLRRALPAAVDHWNSAGERSPEELDPWKRRLDDFLVLWAAFRDARCDPRLLGFESGRAADAGDCRRRLTKVMVEDLRYRFDLAPRGRPRASIEEGRTRPPPAEEQEGGLCAKAPPAECDYCGLNRCWERRLAADEAALNSAWRRALAAIAGRAGLTTTQRSDWTRRLREVQRLWLRWREEACDLDAWETPNPAAHSIFALVTGPCRDSETRARTAVLRRSYGR